MTKIAKKFTLAAALLFSGGYSALLLADSWSGVYVGLMGGYGSTNWSKIHTSDDTLQTTLPSQAKDGGAVWGIFIGDNIGKNYGVELRYQRFANSKISFTQYNEYSPPPDFPAFTMTSKTESYSLLGKLRVPVTQNFELYAVMGGAYTERKDELANVYGLAGVFGAGSRIIFNNHISNALEFDFVTGNASINLEPAKSYLPFLTSLNYKFIYSF